MHTLLIIAIVVLWLIAFIRFFGEIMWFLGKALVVILAPLMLIGEAIVKGMKK